MYLLYNSFGFTGIYILILIISSLIAIVLFNTLIKENNEMPLAFIVTLIAIYFSQGVFAARNQIFSFLIFELEIYSLNGLFIRGKKKFFWILLILAFALVNFHDTVYPLFFVMIMPYLAEIILSRFFNLEKSSKLEYSNITNKKYIFILILIAIIIGFFTPIFGTSYTNLINCMNGISTEFIGELQQVHLLKEIFLMFLAFLIIAILCFTKTKVKIKDILFVFGFMIFSLIAVRNLFFLYLIGIIYCTNIFSDFLNTYIVDYSDALKKIEESKLIIIITSIIIILLSVDNLLMQFGKQYVDDFKYPIDETKYVLKNLDYKNIKLWTDFNWGSYLELNGIKVFLDSRSGMYTEQENKNCTVLYDWYNVSIKNSEKYSEIFKKYGITHVLVENDTNLEKKIIKDKDYILLYKSGAFSLYEVK